MKKISNSVAKNIYIKYINRCNEQFEKDSPWWYLPSSSRERLGSNIQDEFVSCVVLGKEEQKNNIKSKIVSFLRLAKSSVKLGIFVLRNLFSRQFIEQVDILFIHPIHDLPIKKKEGVVWNHYFGELPNAFSKINKMIKVIGPLDPGVFSRRNIYKEKNYEIQNLLSFISIREYTRLVLLGIRFFFNKLVLPEPADPYEKVLFKLIKDEYQEKIYNIFWGLALESAFQEYILIYKPKIVFHTYENNWWERAFNKVCEKNRHIIQKTIGYLHCSILESHMKYTIVNKEWSKKPSPDKILVTGSKAKKILLSRGKYPEEKIKLGFDLRGPNLYQIQQKTKRSAEIRNVLVLLEGLNTMPSFLKLVMDAIANDESYKLSVRCHPVFPMEIPEFKIVREHKFFKNINVTKNSSLDEDLTDADVVIYKGSTAVLYAAYMGLPILKFKDDWWDSDDPLIGCESFKMNFSNSDELRLGIQHFIDMDDASYIREQKFTQKYVWDYMKPYKKEELESLAVELIS